VSIDGKRAARRHASGAVRPSDSDSASWYVAGVTGMVRPHFQRSNPSTAVDDRGAKNGDNQSECESFE
jgi:hypothetical protein